MLIQWHFDAGPTVYSCGSSPGVSPEFPFHPREGNLSRKAKDAGKYLAESTDG
jgi:hypothetical protein